MDVETELLKYSRTEFKLEDLKAKTLPEGVDPAKLEAYLSDQDFKVQSSFSVEKLHCSYWKEGEPFCSL